MTNEEAKVFLDNLKICINEHPVVADWLVEIAERKTENCSEIPNNCDEPTWEQVKEYCNKRCLDIVDSALRKKWYKDEPQTCRNCKWSQTVCRLGDNPPCHSYESKDEPQTEKHKCRRCVYYDISSDYYPCSECVDYSNYSGEVEDEPQTDVYEYHNGKWTKPQTERSE